MKPHVEHYASAREQAKGRIQLAKGAAAVWGALAGFITFLAT
jgi:hypothetical protein